MMREEIKKAREKAILKALEYVEDGMTIGYGTGSTMAQAINYVKRLVHEEGMKLLFIPTSFQSRQLLLENDLPITSLYEHPQPELMIDSFDQTDREGNVIKGGGGAMLLEKVITQASRRVIYVGDYKKEVEKLDRPVPVEILEKAYPHISNTLSRAGLKLVLRESPGKMGPLVSDNGNLLGDVDAGLIEDPEKLDRFLRSIAGIIETGLFPKLADKIIIGMVDGYVKEMNVGRKRLQHDYSIRGDIQNDL